MRVSTVPPLISTLLQLCETEAHNSGASDELTKLSQILNTVFNALRRFIFGVCPRHYPFTTIMFSMRLKVA